MARKSQHTFAKRQREQKKAEKAREKRAKRAARMDPTADSADGGDEDVQAGENSADVNAIDADTDAHADTETVDDDAVKDRDVTTTD